MENEGQWRRSSLRLECGGNEIFAVWKYLSAGISYWINIREFLSDWGWIKQVTISKEILNELCGKEFSEPTMIQKEFVLEGVNARKTFSSPVAFEIYPAKDDIVDKLDVYHLWVVEKNQIPFFVDAKAPNWIIRWKKAVIAGKKLQYSRKQQRIGGRLISVYYVRADNGTELRWYDKQNFKDQIIGNDIVALEFVEQYNSKASVLVCAPKGLKKLPFGLRG